ncbi:MAG TPA: CRISPR-associated endonuclease Cas1, partial [bacterium]|nr:CRISPR-associated endonuclease Cas1 [bacterium]
MAVLYLLQQNTVLRKSGKRLLFCRQRERKTTTHLRQDDVLIDLPIDDVQHVMLFGNIQITTQAMHTLLFNGVETAIYSLSGKLIGQLTPPGGRNIELRIRQFDAYKDTGYRLNFARMILKYKFLATHDFLLDYNHNHPGCFSLDELAAFRQAADRIDSVSDSAQLLGHEGSVSALYFKLL